MQPYSTDNRKRISEVPKGEVFKEVNEAVALAYRNSDKMPDISDPVKKQEFSEMVNGVTNYVYEFLPGYCQGEIKRAIDLGSCGHYGEFYGLNKRSFVKFLLDHKKANPRNEVTVFKPGQITENQSKIPTQDERFTTLKEITIAQYAIFKKGKSIFSGSVVYEFLTKIGLINLTVQERNRIFNEAKLIEAKEAKPGPLRDFVRQIIGQFPTLNADSAAKHRAIYKVVNIFFMQIAETQDLGSLIETKRNDYKI